MGFAEKSPQYQACLKFIEAISPKNITKEIDVVDLTSPTEEKTIDNNNDILFVKDKEQKEGGIEKKDKKLQEDDEHENNGEDVNRDGKQSETS